MYDANTLTQNEIVNLQSEELAKLNAQWESLMAQEAESKKEQNYNNEYTLGQELALGLLGNRTHKNQQEKPMTRLFNALTGSLLGSNMAAYGGNLYDGETNPTGQMTTSKPVYTNNGGGPKTRYTTDGRILTYSTVPATGEVRWVDLDDSKDFNGVTGYRFYDDAGNKMHYTQWQEAANTQKPLPTVEEVDNYIKARGYNPNFIRHMQNVDWMNRSSGAVKPVYPEFYFLSAGRGGMNGAVDALGEVGNTVLTNPWVDAGLTSYFGAHGFNHAINDGIDGWGDAALTALEVMPTMRVGKAIYDASEPFVTALYDNDTLWDRYTTFRGRFGNYGDNLATNIYGTLARRYGFPDKARIPADVIRKIKDEAVFSDELVDLTGTKDYLGNPHINASLDRPVVSHKWGWDGADTYIMPTKSFINQTGESLKSIEPSDIFSNGVRVQEQPQNVTLISGDIEALNNAREAGMQTLSSPRLRRLYQDAYSKYKQLGILGKHPKNEEHWLDYATEVQRLQSRRGTPTLADIKLLEHKTGLKAGVAPKSEYYNALQQIEAMKNASIQDIMDGKVTQYVYPNGRVVEWSDVLKELNLLKRAEYNKIFYDPASYVESNWKTINGVE